MDISSPGQQFQGVDEINAFICILIKKMIPRTCPVGIEHKITIENWIRQLTIIIKKGEAIEIEVNRYALNKFKKILEILVESKDSDADFKLFLKEVEKK